MAVRVSTFREVIMKTGQSCRAAMGVALLMGASGVHALELSGPPSGLRFSTAEALQLSAPAALPFRGRGEWVWMRVAALPSSPTWSWRLSPPDVALRSGDESFSLFRTRGHASVNWQPVSVGAWRLGAALGVMKDLPGSPAGTTWATFPMAAYEGGHYRMNLGLLPPRGSRDSMLLMRFTVPLR
jgi:hypothetical protein